MSALKVDYDIYDFEAVVPFLAKLNCKIEPVYCFATICVILQDQIVLIWIFLNIKVRTLKAAKRLAD